MIGTATAEGPRRPSSENAPVARARHASARRSGLKRARLAPAGHVAAIWRQDSRRRACFGSCCSTQARVANRTACAKQARSGGLGRE